MTVGVGLDFSDNQQTITAPRSDTAFNLAILVLFLVFAIFGASHHAMWRDEVQAFLIARDSASLPELIRNLRFDGHPILWYLIIWPAARLSGNPDAMKPLTITISTLGIAIFLWRGPWTRLEKILWPFGYHVLFEYTIRNRSYCVGMALIMIFGALWPRREQRIIAIGLVLGLMANVHLYFGVLGAAAALALLVDRLVCLGWRGLFANLPRDGAAAIIFAGLALFAAFVAAPPSYGDWSAPKTVGSVGILYAMIQMLAAPILQAGPSMPSLLWSISLVLAMVGSVSILTATLWSVRRSPPAFALLVASLLVLLVMFRVIYSPSAQHSGVLVLAIVASQWIQKSNFTTTHNRSKFPRNMFHLMLLCQSVSGLTMIGYYAVHTHAHGRDTAEFIREKGWATQPVAGFGDSLTPVCGYLRVAACYYAERERWSSYMIYDARPGTVSDPETISDATYNDLIGKAAQLSKAMTFLVPERWPDRPAIMTRHGFRKVAHFGGTMVDDYVVYRKDE